MIRLFCIDDDPMVRTYLVSRLSIEKDIRVVGAAADVSEALCGLRETEADVVLLDYCLGQARGTELLQTILSQASPDRGRSPAVLFCTGWADAAFEAQVRALGAAGVVAKVDLTTQLLSAIRTVAGKAHWFPLSAGPSRMSAPARHA